MKSSINDIDVFNTYFSILDYIPFIVFIVELNPTDGFYSGRVVKCNQIALDFIKYPENEIKRLGFRFFEKIIHSNDLPRYGNIVEKLIRGGNEFQSEIYRIKPKNSKGFINIECISKIIQPLSDDKPIYFINTVVIPEIKINSYFSSQNIHFPESMDQDLAILTKREKEISKLIFLGKSDKDIAILLNISCLTVKTHRTKIRKKFKVKNTPELIQFFLKETIKKI